MNLLQAKGFVLEARNYGEADKIVQLYTLQLGRIKAIVKGVRKPKSKLASAIDLFTESGFSLHKRPSADLYVLTQAKVINAYSDLKKDLKTITALQVLADILIQSLHDTEPHPEVFALLRGALAAMGVPGAEPEALVVSFLLKFLELLGNPLELAVCVECGAELQRKKAYLIPHRGGALCEDCCPAGPSRLKVSPVELEVLKKLRTLPLEKTRILKMKPLFVRRVFLTALEYLERTIEKKLKAVEFYLKMVPPGGLGMIAVLMGVSGSGKTTLGRKLAEKMGWLFLEGDDFHSLGNRAKMEAGVSLDDADRLPWLRAIAGELERLTAEKSNAVLACSALKKKYRDLLSQEVPLRWFYLKGSRELIRLRMEGRRGHFMKPDLLESQFSALEEPKEAMMIDIRQDPDKLVEAIVRQLQGL